MSAAIQTTRAIGGYALPVDPVWLAGESCFEVILRGLDLHDEQIAPAEDAVELVPQGVYPRSVA